MATEALIVDDCKFTTKVLSRVMEELGFAVQSVASGEAAVDFLSNHTAPAILLVDWVMPGMSGVQLVSWMRTHPQHLNTPVVMVTAEKDLAKVMEAMQTGANEYLMKPFSKEDVEEKLRILGFEKL
jgi:two-component system chemotaxis response regulator CheY